MCYIKMSAVRCNRSNTNGRGKNKILLALILVLTNVTDDAIIITEQRNAKRKEKYHEKISYHRRGQ